MINIILLSVFIFISTGEVFAQNIEQKGGCNQSNLGGASVQICKFYGYPLGKESIDPKANPDNAQMPLGNRQNALIGEAELWKNRRGVEFHDFSELKSSITESDKRAFNKNEKEAWEILNKAEAILSWPELGLNSKTKALLPILIRFDGPESNYAGKIIVESIQKELRGNGFKIVNNIKDAALFIFIKDVVMDSAYTEVSRRDGHQGICEFQINALWVGGINALFGKYDASEKVMMPDKYSAEKAAVNAAVNSTSRLFLDWVRQH